MALVLLSLGQLGLTGLAIDFIRSCIAPGTGGVSAWPLGWKPPADWHPLAVVGLVSATILGLAGS